MYSACWKAGGHHEFVQQKGAETDQQGHAQKGGCDARYRDAARPQGQDLVVPRHQAECEEDGRHHRGRDDLVDNQGNLVQEKEHDPLDIGIVPKEEIESVEQIDDQIDSHSSGQTEQEEPEEFSHQVSRQE